MKLPRDMGGEELAVLLRRRGYEITRQTGSHIRSNSCFWAKRSTTKKGVDTLHTGLRSIHG